MKIKGIKIYNFRSFNEDGVEINGLSRINIFIGKNNSGKSNILRFLQLFNEYLTSPHKFSIKDNEHYYKRSSDKEPYINILYDENELFEKYIIDKYNMHEDQFNFSITMTKREPYDWSYLSKFEEDDLFNLQKKYRQADKQSLIEAIGWSFSLKIENGLNLFKNIIYVPHFRSINEEQPLSQYDEKYINGLKIISKIFEMQNPDLGDEIKKEQLDKIVNFIKRLLGVPSLSVEVPHTKDKIIINMYGNRLSIDSFGTGLHELVILVSALAIYENHVVCIEEPELHLHPELQRELLDFIENDTNNVYFITTHSNVFIDRLRDISIYHVSYDGEKSTVNRIETNEHGYDLLDDLGYKASDLLQCNGIIWVEGPSDRVYLKRWIQLTDPDLVEGIHYSIMFYGGRLLSHLSMTTTPELDDNFIRLLIINRNAIVIIDSDIMRTKTAINFTKKRINDETERGNCWITNGKEIENYLTKRAIEDFIKNEYNKIVNITIDHLTPLQISLDKITKIFKLNYNRNKVALSKKIANYIIKEDLSILDLEKRISGVVKTIRKWNHLDKEQQ